VSSVDGLCHRNFYHLSKTELQGDTLESSLLQIQVVYCWLKRLALQSQHVEGETPVKHRSEDGTDTNRDDVAGSSDGNEAMFNAKLLEEGGCSADEDESKGT